MTDKQKFGVVRNKIVELIPDILKLQFGCEIERKNSERHYKVIEDLGWGANEKKVWINSIPFGIMPLELEKDFIENGGDFKIIGRAIRLSDIVRAIRNSPKVKELSPFRSNIHPLYWEQTILKKWDLERDDLDLQSFEIWDLLFDLLCK